MTSTLPLSAAEKQRLQALTPADYVGYAARLAALTARLAPAREPAGEAVKADLRAAGEAALAAGVFGVPTFVEGGRLFWGLDSLPMLRAYLDGDAWFDGPAWDAAPAVPSGLPSVR